MMQDAVYGGVNAAVLTAMRPDLSLDIGRTAAHGSWLLANGCNGLAVLGTTGEANSIGISERMQLLEGLVASGLPPARLLPGVGTPALTDTVLLARHAAGLDCPGVLVLPPFFYKNPSEDGLFAYFSELIQQLGGVVRLYLYNFPAHSAVPVTVALIARLLRACPGAVHGIKDSSGDFANTRSYVDHFAADGFEVYCGDDGALHDLLQAGGAGCITAAANLGCGCSSRVYANWDNEVGRQAQATLSAIRKAVSSAALIPGLKALVARHTGDSGWDAMRPPHLPLSAEAQARLFAAFDACGVTLPRPG